ncbi:MAG: hypothetical protein CVU40_10595 [Chloroflexi bacterium HGW-Chloroflexi-2]|jgi:hypothetical protein|nr:MAG: hypothetical protein CVU40_10595 [Chloroflexi bacterium HGW-Chloroflexi-2]
MHQSGNLLYNFFSCDIQYDRIKDEIISMLNIVSSLNGQDLGFLKIVANAWGIEIKAPDAYTARTQLAMEMNNPEIIKEIYEVFPENVRQAFDTLLDNDGKIPWAKFARDFGEIQVMGSARRDRERPDLNPKTPTEYLWYRAFIGRAFLSTETEPQEFAYIPEEIFSCLEPAYIQKKQIPGRSATTKETQIIFTASDRILDDICTLLAAIRNGFSIDILHEYCDIPTDFLNKLIFDIKLISDKGILDPDQVRNFLETSREKSLMMLTNHWIESKQLNEMELMPDFIIEGVLDRNHHNVRQFLLDQISLVPSGQWWNLESFVSYVFQINPDFQRPAGNYDTWYIKKAETGEYLRGFEHWDVIDGAYIRFMLTGPLFWLGLVDLACSESDNKIQAFKCSQWYANLLSNHPPDAIKPEDVKLLIDSYGKIVIPLRFSRSIRYQISRFCDWNGKSKDGYAFQISPVSLQRAKDQGLKISHFLKIVQSVLPHPFPPKLKSALENWEHHGTQAHFTQAILLHLADPEAINQLQNTSAKKFIQAILNPNTVAVLPNGVEQVRKTLIEMGYLSE